ncbi:hypothetical protein ACHAWF_018555 [Thalassiosira exigua]
MASSSDEETPAAALPDATVDYGDGEGGGDDDDDDAAAGSGGGGLANSDSLGGGGDSEGNGDDAAADGGGSGGGKAVSKKKLCLGLGLGLAFLVAAGLAVGLGVGLTRNKNQDGGEGGGGAEGKDASTSDGGEAVEGGGAAPDVAGGQGAEEEEEGEESVSFGTSDLGVPTPVPVPGGIVPWVEESIATPPPVVLAPLAASMDCRFAESQVVDVRSPPYGNMTANVTDLLANGTEIVVGTESVRTEKKLSGGASAFSGSTAAIVAYDSDGREGGVWLLERRDLGALGDSWEVAKAIQTEGPDQLGWGVGLDGGTLAIGAPGKDGREEPGIVGWYWTGTGEARVWEKNGEGGAWEETATLAPEGADDSASFGNSVDVADCGCRIAVGAWHDRDSRGSVHVYAKGDDGTWTQVQRLAPPDSRRTQSDGLHGNYGYAVAIADDYLAVKAPYDSYTGSTDFYDPNRGVVYVYRREANGTYVEVNRLFAPEKEQVGSHHRDLVFLDDFLLVGLPGNNVVYVFERRADGADGDAGGAGYVKMAELVPSAGVEPGGTFGNSLSGDGSSVMVGDRGAGRSHLFSYEEGTWRERATFEGTNAALSGDVMLRHDPKAFSMEGSDGGSGGQYGGEVNFFDLVCD